MNEEIIIRMSFDATAVKRGTMTMLDQQKKAAMEYVSFWKKTLNEREQAEKQAFEKSKDRWKQELDAQRKISGARGGAKTVAEQLSRNVTTKSGKAVFGAHGLSGGSYQEMGVLARELASGNIGGFVRSLSVLGSRMGWLGSVIGKMVNPVTAVLGGLAAGVAMVRGRQLAGYNARMAAKHVGFSSAGYANLMQQAELLAPGGGAAAANAARNLYGLTSAAGRGDASATARFSRWGISMMSGSRAATTEQIFERLLEKLDNTADAAKRAAMAQDILGDSYKELQPLLDMGAESYQQMKRNRSWRTPSSAELKLAEESGIPMNWSWSNLKTGTKNALLKHWITLTSRINKATGGGQVDYLKAMESGQEIDAKMARMWQTGALRLSKGEIAGRLRHLGTFDPARAISYRSQQLSQSESASALEDRGKLDLATMASTARELTGHIRPQLYSVTERQRIAMKVDDLEAMATNAWLKGDDEGMKSLRGEADEMRRSNPWLKFADRNPTEKLENALADATRQLEDMNKTLIFSMTGGGQ